MRPISVILFAIFLSALVLTLILLARTPPMLPASTTTANTTSAPATGPAPLHLGLIPERDIFQYRAAYKALADYLATKLARPVELRTVHSYEGVLQDFADNEVDAAFLGSLVAALACDRFGAQVLIKPEYTANGAGGNEGGVSTYRGVVFVPENSPIRRFEDLSGKTLAAVRTTTGGNLFPIYLMVKHGMLEAPQAPKLAWVGTHDEVAREVMAGRAEAGALKDLRLEACLKQYPDFKIRRLATSDPVPENALVVRNDLPAPQVELLRKALLEMDHDPTAAVVLAGLKLRRFVPCSLHDYQVIHDMVDAIGPAWDRLGIQGPPPRRPTTRPGGG